MSFCSERKTFCKKEKKIKFSVLLSELESSFCKKLKHGIAQKTGPSFSLGYESNCREEKITARKKNNTKKKKG